MKILNIGSLNIDRSYQVPHIVQPGETLCSTSYCVYCGGKGLNQSIALARAGAEVWHAGAVGEDGDILIQALADSGVHTEWVIRSRQPSGHAIIQVDPNGQNSIVICPGANNTITPQVIDHALESFAPGDLLLLQNEVSHVGYAIQAGHAKGLLVALNPSPIDDSLLASDLSGVDLFMVNEVEGTLLAGGEAHRPADLLTALARHYPHAALLLTMGDQGALYQDTHGRICQPIFPCQAVDTSGAGDTFCGYFLAALAEGSAPADALRLAAAAASIAVSRPGTAAAIPPRQEAEALCRTGQASAV